MNSYRKHQELMFYSPGKNSEKPYGGATPHPPFPFLVRPRVKNESL